VKINRLAAALFLCLVASPSFAASKLFISEYGTLAATNSGGVPAQAAAEPSLTDQAPVDFSGGAASSAVFGAQTRLVRLMCDTRCAIRISTAGTAATTSNKPLAADSPEYFGVQPGDKVSVIASP
jgi:hypothetical protein